MLDVLDFWEPKIWKDIGHLIKYKALIVVYVIQDNNLYHKFLFSESYINLQCNFHCDSKQVLRYTNHHHLAGNRVTENKLIF